MPPGIITMSKSGRISTFTHSLLEIREPFCYTLRKNGNSTAVLQREVPALEIKRDKYLNDLIARMHNGLVKVVTGVRRCGKSYNRLFSFCSEKSGHFLCPFAGGETLCKNRLF